MSTALVSVIMPVYNTEKYLAQSIESILNQTFSDFEFLIFDDGSTDNSRNIIADYAARDTRIVPFYFEKNSGYVIHLNKGVLVAKGEFIARMDSDDISLPERLSVQMKFLRDHPDVSVVGSSSIRISEDGNELGISRRNASSAALLWQSFFTNPLAHPTVMFRKSVIIEAGLYNECRLPSEDFDLWTRVLRRSQLSNIDMPLVKYREHPLSVSQLQEEHQRKQSMKVLEEHWSAFCHEKPPGDILKFLRNFHQGFELQPLSMVRPAYYLIMKLYVKTLKRYGMVNEVEEDAFNKLYYLVLRSFRLSFFTFIELASTLTLVFPLRSFRKLLRV